MSRTILVSSHICHTDAGGVGYRLLAVVAAEVADEHFNPAVPVLITFSTQYVPRMIATWTPLRFNNKEGMSIFFLLIAGACLFIALLSSNLSAGDCDGAKVCSSALW